MNQIPNVRISVDVEVNPTEDLNKIRVAIQKMLGDLQLNLMEERDGKSLVGEAEGLEMLSSFRVLLKKEQIRKAARRVLFSGLRENMITLYLNKQVAYAGHISFSQSSGESPLGPIRVTIQCAKPDQLIDWLAPRKS